MLCLAAIVATAGTGCTDSVAAATGPTQVLEPRTIVALGDSLTAGKGLDEDEAYPAILERMLTSAGLPFKVRNYGVSGETSADALRRLDNALAESPAILIVALGANDGLRGVPIAQVRRNLETIIEAAQARNIAVLLCGMETPPFNGWEYTLAFHRLFPALAEKYSLPLVPFLLEGVIGNSQMVQQDHVHPNAAGAAVIARTIWPYLEPLATSLTRLTAQIPI
jgi:acyl-CoA thioesterase-1